MNTPSKPKASRPSAGLASLSGLWRTFVVASLYCCFSSIEAQEAPSRAADAAQASGADYSDEIVVEGRSRSALRIQLRLAEDALYSRFNEINSNDEFDVRCTDEAPPNSNIDRRVCRPRYLREAYAQASREAYLWITGSSFASDSQQFLNDALAKGELLGEEMRRLAQEDEQFQQAVVRYIDLKRAVDGQEPLGGLLPTAASERASDDGNLPYDAARITDVEIGGEPWVGELEHGVFAIAHVFGKIRSVELTCDGRSARLRWKRGVEWQVPDDRQRCSVRVDAPPHTSFAVYEFD